MFEQLYHSPWHNPGAFWAIGFPLLFLGWWRARQAASPRGGTLARWALLFQLVILLDAGLQGELSPIAGLPVFSAVSIVFVVLGDVRWYALVLRFGPLGARGWTWLGGSVALGLVVPIASYALTRALGAREPRILFLIYEAMFAAIALGTRGYLERAPLPAEAGAWLRRVTTFEAIQYVGWATADVLILTVGDVGYLLRLVPNAMYYAAFVPFAWWTAPPEVRG